MAARESACARLRTLLADGAWHSALEFVDAAKYWERSGRHT